MKKYAALLIALACALTAFPGFAQSEAKISIVATIFPQYDFARAIAGDKADIAMLLRPGAERHSFEPTPRDVIAIGEADVFIFVGGHNDSWIYELLDTMDTQGIKTVELIRCVDTELEQVVEGMEGTLPGGEDDHDHDHDDHDHAEEGATHHHEDEHVWTSPVKAKALVTAIAEAIIAADPDNRAYYEANRDAYIAELDALDAQFRDVVDTAARRTIVMGDRFPLRYLADEYGLEYYAAFPGCAQDTEVSAQTMAYLIDKVTEARIPVVFQMELSNGKIASAIAEATGAEVRLLHSAHNLTSDDFASGLTYLDIMRANVQALKEALN